jgi:predicted RNase H-like nuclease (RuvC/YqgF family)
MNLSSDNNFPQDLKARLNNANAKIAWLEKDIQQYQTRSFEKDLALEKSGRDFDQSQNKQKCIESEIIKTREDVSRLKAECEALKATNTQLQIQLEGRESEKTRAYGEERLQLTHLSDENRRLLKAMEDERVAKELFQRELKDSKRLWEAEVKAKGVLTDRITRYERSKLQNEANNVNPFT